MAHSPLRDSTPRVCFQNKSRNCEASQLLLPHTLSVCLAVFTGGKKPYQLMMWADFHGHQTINPTDSGDPLTFFREQFWGRLKWQRIDFMHNVQTLGSFLRDCSTLGRRQSLVVFVSVNSGHPTCSFCTGNYCHSRCGRLKHTTDFAATL